MLMQYFPILVFIGFSALLGTVLLSVGWFLGRHNPAPRGVNQAAKDAPYECGFPAFEDARLPFNVRFYLIAILFIIFDLETAFLVPWAVILRHLPSSEGIQAFVAMMVFLGLLVIGFIYEWRKGALEWE